MTPEATLLARLARGNRDAPDDAPSCRIVALSGGLDSTALLRLCARHREIDADAPAYRALHVHHGLRGAEADDDATFCEQLADRHAIPLDTVRVDAAAHARDHGLGLEAAGRRLRHQAYASAVETHRAIAVLLAHHADDQAETVLMRLLQGAGPRGLAGMAPQTWMRLPGGEAFRIERPLLDVPREALRGYVERQGLSWREDRSNQDLRFLRNRLRHEVLPFLEARRPDARARLLRLGRVCRSLTRRLDRLAACRLDAIREETPAGTLLPMNEIGRLETGLLPYLLRAWLAERHASPPRMSRIAAVAEDLLKSEKGVTSGLGGSCRARRERDGILLLAGEETPASPDSVPLPPGAFEIEALGVRIRAEEREAPASIPPEDRTDPEVAWLDRGAVRPPLRLRERRPGDRFRPLGASGQRKVKDLLIDRKAPRRTKEAVRILEDEAGILWVWPCRIAHRARLTPSTRRALRVTLRPLSRSADEEGADSL